MSQACSCESVTSGGKKVYESSRIMPKKAIPERWECYAPVGRHITRTRIFPFKVPLGKVICDNLPQSARFSPKDLIQQVNDSGYRLGLVIDLTNTSRYYNPQEFKQAGIEYCKLFTVGHVIPHRNIVQRFTRTIQEFLSQHLDHDLLIGVHCTHGVNRTGYLICRYMIEHLGLTATEALTAFAEARGYGVERQNYITDLHKLSEAKQASNRATSHVICCNDSSIKASKEDQRSSNSSSHATERVRHKGDDHIVRGITGGKVKKRRQYGNHLYSSGPRTGQHQITHYKAACFDSGYSYIDRNESSPDHFEVSSGGRQQIQGNSSLTRNCKPKDVIHQHRQQMYYPVRERGSVNFQQSTSKGLNDNHTEVGRFEDGWPPCWGKNAGQSAWSSFHGYKSFRQPMQYGGRCITISKQKK